MLIKRLQQVASRIQDQSKSTGACNEFDTLAIANSLLFDNTWRDRRNPLPDPSTHRSNHCRSVGVVAVRGPVTLFWYARSGDGLCHYRSCPLYTFHESLPFVFLKIVMNFQCTKNATLFVKIVGLRALAPR